ncbi:MAG: DUF445 domain-containing protein [Cyclobacteriaceae bacterium]
MKSKVGIISLLTAVMGFLVLEIGIHFGWFQGLVWRILATGFEAGTIGGLADWFAVSALFYEIPIPLVRKHTNIIVKNRDKLTEGIVELVTTKWLSPEILRERLADVEISSNVVQVLETQGNMDKTLGFVRTVFSRFAEELDHPKMGIVLQKLLKDQVQDLDLGRPLGKWLASIIEQQKHHDLIGMGLHQFSLSIQDPDTRQVVFKKLKDAVEIYSKQDWVKKSAIWIGKRTGGIDLDLLTDRVLDLALVLVKETKDDPNHPIRIKLDQYLLEFALLLESGDEQALGYIEQLKNNLVVNDHTRKIILSLLSNFKSTLKEQLSSSHTPLMEFIRKQLLHMLDDLKQDEQARVQLDTWLKETVTKLVNKYHPELGNMVRSSLGKLDDKSIMLQIKEKVGNDLQYIRLNGAVVGGMVGLLIALFRWALL